MRYHIFAQKEEGKRSPHDHFAPVCLHIIIIVGQGRWARKRRRNRRMLFTPKT